MENQDFEYARLADFVKSPGWFDAIAPTPGAKRWWLNTHRAELLRRGVLLKHGRRWFVKPNEFKTAARDILFQTSQQPVEVGND